MSDDMALPASQDRATHEPSQLAGSAVPVGIPSAKSIMALEMPTDAELHDICARKWAKSGPFNIDQWPADILAVSMPTKFIPVEDFDEFWQIWDGDTAVMGKYAAKLDDAMDWRDHFIRMNSRSPKDSAYPGLPITCAGRQAMSWISSSERCADDTSLHQHARKPFFICAREFRPIRPELEFRCFAKDGKLIAVSRYDYRNPAIMSDDCAPQVWEAASRFYGEHIGRHFETVVFDLHAPGTAKELLIELNPYGMSDPCLFGSYAEVEKGGVRIVAQEMETRQGGDGTAPSRSDDSPVSESDAPTPSQDHP